MSGQHLALQIPNQLPINAGLRPWLENIDTPSWLLNDIHDNVWHINDEGIAPPLRINWEYALFDPVTQRFSFLTDHENAGLLEVAQIFCLSLRNSQVANIESSRGQLSSTRALMLLFAWMRLNYVDRIDQLDSIHFKMYMQAAPWGMASLLEIDRRFDDYVRFLKAEGQKMPTRLNAKGADVIDLRKVYLQIGLPPETSNYWGKDFTYKFWHTVDQLYGNKYVDHHQQYLIGVADEPASVPQTAKSVETHIRVWQLLHDMSHLLPQKCTVNPSRDFVPGEEMTAKKIAAEALKAANIDNDEGLTETIPDLQGFHLLDRAIRWVLMYSNDLLELRQQTIMALKKVGDITNHYKRTKCIEKLLQKFSPKQFSASDPSAPWPLDAVNFRERESQNLSILDATGRYLMAACIVVIAAFSARRKMEVLNIKGGEPTEEDSAPRAIFIDQDKKPWLWCWIEKTLQKWDRVPIPEVVVKAIEVLEKLTATTRVKNCSRNLFELEMLITEGTAKFDFQHSINLFADFVQVPPLNDGSQWVFKPHQFRRFFALMYMYRYKYGEHGKFEALSWHLRHLDMEGTKRYIEEIHESDMLKAHRKHIVVDLMSDVLRKERKAAGPGGEAMQVQLNEMIREVIKGSEILGGTENPSIARKIAERVMHKLDIEMVPFLWGYCYAYKEIGDGTFHGNCIKEGACANGPDIVRAKPKTCFGCKHLYVDDHFHPYWETAAKKYRQGLDNGMLSDVMADMARKNLAVFEAALGLYFDIPKGES